MMKRKKTHLCVFLLCPFFIAVTPCFAQEDKPFPPISPEWVFGHWVWEDNQNTEEAQFQLVNGYRRHRIPVDALIIDSPWSSEYNNFLFKKQTFPDPAGLIARFHKRGIRVVLWVTGMMNQTNINGSGEPVSSKIFKVAKRRKYFFADGAVFKWWKGTGAFIDFTNPAALEWWHKLMSRVLNLGFDGWKVDETDSYFPKRARGFGGVIERTDYRSRYYSEMYDFTISKNKNAAVLSRAVDRIERAPQGFAPRNKTNVSWVGDQTHTWGAQGLRLAIKNVLDSARNGYSVVGSDIGGYLGHGAIPKVLLIRWAQFGALCPLMLNGGQGTHEPWRYDRETTNIYRKYVNLHRELFPLWYSLMRDSHRIGVPIVRPLKDSSLDYMIGDDLLVSPVTEPEYEIIVAFPTGVWHNFWDHSKVYSEGPTRYEVSLDNYPLFIRRNAVIPVKVRGTQIGNGVRAFRGTTTLLVAPGGGNEDYQRRYITGEQASALSLQRNRVGDTLRVHTKESKVSVTWMVNKSPVKVSVNGKELSRSTTGRQLEKGNYYFDSERKRVYFLLPEDNETTKVLLLEKKK